MNRTKLNKQKRVLIHITIGLFIYLILFLTLWYFYPLNKILYRKFITIIVINIFSFFLIIIIIAKMIISITKKIKPIYKFNTKKQTKIFQMLAIQFPPTYLSLSCYCLILAIFESMDRLEISIPQIDIIIPIGLFIVIIINFILYNKRKMQLYGISKNCVQTL